MNGRDMRSRRGVLGLSIAVIANAAMGQGAPGTEVLQKPEALVRLEQARRSIKSGTITWQETGRYGPEPYTYISRYARNGDMIFEKRGDVDGWVALGRGADGKNCGCRSYPCIPEKGWNAEYIEVVQGGVATGVRCTLKQYDGVWLPETGEYFLGDQRCMDHSYCGGLA